MFKANQKLGIHGWVEIIHFRDGKEIERRNFLNLITNVGMASVAALMLADVAETAFDFIAIGTGSTAANITDTTLVTETHRQAGVGTRITTTVTDDTAQLQTTFNFGGTFALREVGMLSDVSFGALLARQVYAAINVESGDSLQITWKVQVSAV